jgi:environmental stress-induced protein Ves
MNWKLVALDAVPAQAWRNGGGLTRELLAWPQAMGWRLRLSVADVRADGPFSLFDGIERWFAVLEGDGVMLRMGDEEHQLTRGDAPLRFDGGRNVQCTLRAGPTRDFNLMAAPGRARLSRLRGTRSFSVAAGTLLAAYAHAEAARIALGDAVLELPPRHLAWRLLEQAADGEIACEDALWMEARP